jgi:hydroxyethylthiazole kinase-like uncharacterized protein yjeF
VKSESSQAPLTEEPANTEATNTGPEPKYYSSNKLFSSAQIKAFEQEFFKKTGISSLDLMHEAGTQIAAYINTTYSFLSGSDSEVHVICGPGNNGGDGVTTARVLKELGFQVSLLIVKSAKYSEEMLAQIESLETDKYAFTFIDTSDSPDLSRVSIETFSQSIKKADLVIDCLLGIGQKGELRGIISDCCTIVMAEKDRRDNLNLVSIDLPTGFNCDSGQIYKNCIKPDITLVLQYFKTGQVQSPAFENLGKVVILDIGLDLLDYKSEYELITNADLISRPRDCHKGHFGHVLLVAGSPSMPGAGLLAASACLRAGAGLTTLTTADAGFAASFCAYLPELMYLISDNDWTKAANKIVSSLDKYSSLLIGPGLGLGEEQTGFVFHLLREVSKRNLPCVLDADGLSALADLRKMGVPISLSNVIITPHIGEASRLLGISSLEIQNNRYAAAEKLQAELDCCVVLKGPSTICRFKQSGLVNSSGGPFLSTAGSGDVLAGIITSFLAQGYSQTQSVSNAVFIHGLAGELAHAQHQGPILASDIITQIPFALGT